MPLAYAHGSQGRDRSGWLGAGIGPGAAGCAPGPTRSPVIAASPERPHMGGQLQQGGHDGGEESKQIMHFDE